MDLIEAVVDGMCASMESQIFAGTVRITFMLTPVPWEKESKAGEQPAKGLSVAYLKTCRMKSNPGQILPKTESPPGRD